MYPAVTCYCKTFQGFVVCFYGNKAQGALKALSLEIVNKVFIHLQSKGCQGELTHILGWSVTIKTNKQIFIEFCIIQRRQEDSQSFFQPNTVGNIK